MLVAVTATHLREDGANPLHGGLLWRVPPNPEKLASIYQAVQEHPSQCPGAIARLLSISLSQVTRCLPALEQRGYLLK
jgi:hypothetical protein